MVINLQLPIGENTVELPQRACSPAHDQVQRGAVDSPVFKPGLQERRPILTQTQILNHTI